MRAQGTVFACKGPPARARGRTAHPHWRGPPGGPAGLWSRPSTRTGGTPVPTAGQDPLLWSGAQPASERPACSRAQPQAPLPSCCEIGDRRNEGLSACSGGCCAPSPARKEAGWLSPACMHLWRRAEEGPAPWPLPGLGGPSPRQALASQPFPLCGARAARGPSLLPQHPCSPRIKCLVQPSKSRPQNGPGGGGSAVSQPHLKGGVVKGGCLQILPPGPAGVPQLLLRSWSPAATPPSLLRPSRCPPGLSGQAAPRGPPSPSAGKAQQG